MGSGPDGSTSIVKRVLKVFGFSAAVGVIGGLLAPPKKSEAPLVLPERESAIQDDGELEPRS